MDLACHLHLAAVTFLSSEGLAFLINSLATLDMCRQLLGRTVWRCITSEKGLRRLSGKVFRGRERNMQNYDLLVMFMQLQQTMNRFHTTCAFTCDLVDHREVAKKNRMKGKQYTSIGSTNRNGLYFGSFGCLMWCQSQIRKQFCCGSSCPVDLMCFFLYL